MADVTTTVTIPSNADNIVGLSVRWVKNGIVATVNHPVALPITTYTFKYLTDVPNGVLNAGDGVSVSVASYDANNLTSAFVPSAPVSVTVPVVLPPAPTSVTIANS